MVPSVVFVLLLLGALATDDQHIVVLHLDLDLLLPHTRDVGLEAAADTAISFHNVFDPFSLDLLDPFDNMLRSIVPVAADTAAFANARIDWKETPEAHVFKVGIPGVKKEEVKLKVEDGNVLVISGQRVKEEEDKNDTWHRVKRSSGQFVRRFCLRENTKVDQVKAGLENSVLTVTVAKAEVKKPEVEAIEISG